jgi:hypothetical protein
MEYITKQRHFVGLSNPRIGRIGGPSIEYNEAHPQRAKYRSKCDITIYNYPEGGQIANRPMTSSLLFIVGDIQ